MTEDLILTEESVVSEEQAVSDEPVTAKKAYITPQMEIEYFDVEDIITTSNKLEGDVGDGYGDEPGNPGTPGTIGGDF